MTITLGLQADLMSSDRVRAKMQMAMSSGKLRIGEVARRVGVRPSAVRYYEERGLIAPEGRSGGKRVYGPEAVERMALISFAKDAGFSLDEIRKLLAGFPEDTPAGVRWSELAAAKLVELDALSQRIDVMRAALHRISRCSCRDLDQCARGIAAKKWR
jgi:MerR family transcriptional regulator, redox-sensitive transcriptional activator SoxR